MSEEYITVKDAAERFGFVESTLLHAIRRGRLEAGTDYVKVGRNYRIKPEAIQRYLDSRAPRKSYGRPRKQQQRT